MCTCLAAIQGDFALVKRKRTIEKYKTAKNMMENTTPKGLIKWKGEKREKIL